MQVQKENREIEMSGFSGAAKQFSIEATPKAFQILSSSIYTDKPLAVIRELSCNAYDAQVEAGTSDRPFEVHLPNHFEPFFSIRDYGTGLSDEDITGLYSTYFKSTKTNSNDVIGCMGLGSKSPFAYVDQFTVTSYFNGKKGVFMVFMDDDGTPSIMLTESTPTDEENGIMIHMMANQSDFSTFADRARRFYHRFPVHPIITGNSSVDLSKVKYTLEGPNYKLRTNDEHLAYGDHKGAYAIQGHVAYPIKVDKIKVPMTDQQRELLQSMAIDITFPIGELEVAASREELSYNKLTQANIIKAVETIQAHVPQHAAKVLADAKTEFEARALYQRWLGENSSEARFMAKVLGRKLAWNGKEISGHHMPIYMYNRDVLESVKTVSSSSLDNEAVKTLIDMHHIDTYGDILQLGEYELRSSRTKKLAGSYSRSTEVAAGDISGDSPETVVVIVDDEKLNRGIVRLMQHNFGDKEKDVIALRITPGFEQQVKDQFKGFDNFVLASTLDIPPPEVKNTVVRDVRKLMKVRKINDYYYSGAVETDETTHDVSQGGTYVVLYSKELISPGDEWLEKGNEPRRGNKKILEMLREAQRVGLIDFEKDNIYAFNSTHKALITKHPNWVSLYDLLKQRIATKLADKEFLANVENFYTFQALITDNDTAANTIVTHNTAFSAVKMKVKSPSSKFVKYFDELTEIAKAFDAFVIQQGVAMKPYLDRNLAKPSYNHNDRAELGALMVVLENATEFLKTKDITPLKSKALTKANKVASKLKQNYPLFAHLANSHFDVKKDSKGLALYVNMCDKTSSLIKASITPFI